MPSYSSASASASASATGCDSPRSPLPLHETTPPQSSSPKANSPHPSLARRILTPIVSMFLGPSLSATLVASPESYAYEEFEPIEVYPQGQDASTDDNTTIRALEPEADLCSYCSSAHGAPIFDAESTLSSPFDPYPAFSEVSSLALSPKLTTTSSSEVAHSTLVRAVDLFQRNLEVLTAQAKGLQALVHGCRPAVVPQAIIPTTASAPIRRPDTPYPFDSPDSLPPAMPRLSHRDLPPLVIPQHSDTEEYIDSDYPFDPELPTAMPRLKHTSLPRLVIPTAHSVPRLVIPTTAGHSVPRVSSAQEAPALTSPRLDGDSCLEPVPKRPKLSLPTPVSNPFSDKYRVSSSSACSRAFIDPVCIPSTSWPSSCYDSDSDNATASSANERDQLDAMKAMIEKSTMGSFASPPATTISANERDQLDAMKAMIGASTIGCFASPAATAISVDERDARAAMDALIAKIENSVMAFGFRMAPCDSDSNEVPPMSREVKQGDEKTRNAGDGDGDGDGSVPGEEMFEEVVRAIAAAVGGTVRKA